MSTNRKRKAREDTLEKILHTTKDVPLILFARQRLILTTCSGNILVNVAHHGQDGKYYSFKGLKRNRPTEWEVQFVRAGTAEITVELSPSKTVLHQIYIRIKGYKSNLHSGIAPVRLYINENQIAQLFNSPEVQLDIGISSDPPDVTHPVYSSAPEFVASVPFVTTSEILPCFRQDQEILAHMHKHYHKFMLLYQQNTIANWFWFSLGIGCRKLSLFLNFGHTPMLYQRNQYGESPLHLLLRKGTWKSAKLAVLLMQMIDLRGWEARDAAGITPFYLATVNSMVKVLTNIYNKVDCKLYRSLQKISQVQKEHASWAVDQYIQLRRTTTQPLKIIYGSALTYAVRYGLISEIQSLVEKGANLEYTLHTAAEAGDVYMIKLLHSLGAKVDERNLDVYGSVQPIHLAAKHGNTEALKTLIELGAQVDTVDSGGRLPIHHAASSECLDTVMLLVGLGLSIDDLDDEGMQPIHHAAKHGRLATVIKLVELGSQIDAVDRNGNKPIDVAANYENLATAEKLFQIRANGVGWQGCLGSELEMLNTLRQFGHYPISVNYDLFG